MFDSGSVLRRHRRSFWPLDPGRDLTSESRMRSRLHGNRNWGELSFELCRLHSWPPALVHKLVVAVTGVVALHLPPPAALSDMPGCRRRWLSAIAPSTLRNVRIEWYLCCQGKSALPCPRERSRPISAQIPVYEQDYPTEFRRERVSQAWVARRTL
ncbi:hypothetical protein PC115_g6928 [Phytophthora cactorum]|uniref:Uncharacterized protein n=1 Tax=Phytophthora cactorum TaxID=29920 RepID=A0A8T1CTF6_9STRA|nr:hypothetical protein PC115_g6928 [Phytophthora cactorum]